MARERATRSDDASGDATRDSDTRGGREILTRAEARALSRCAPLTPAEFKAHARVAEQSADPLRAVLTGLESASPRTPPERR